MDKLIVKNFGPIKNISINVNDINIFIGPTSSGKSTIAKLIAIFINPEPDFINSQSNDSNKFFERFKGLLVDYNIDFELKEDTEIRYSSGGLNLHVTNKEFKSEVLRSDHGENLYYKLQYWPIYIPAERTLLPNVGESLFGLMKNNVSIPQILIEFGSHFESARRHIKSFDILTLNAKYEYSNGGNYLTLPDNTKIPLESASSGIQSTVPMMLVISYYDNIRRQFDNCFIVEEPEMNLYPSTQKLLIEFIISKVNHSNNKLIITTHSPYTLTTIDNLIQAKNAFEKHPELKEEINAVIPENLWIDFNKISCFYFEDGYCRSTLDNENQSIGPSNIDDVSIMLGETFDRLLDLKYKG